MPICNRNKKEKKIRSMIKKNTCCNIEKHRPDYSGRSMKWLMAVLVRRNTLNVTAQTQTAISVFKE